MRSICSAARAYWCWAMAVSVSIRVVIGDGVRFCCSTSVAYRRQSAIIPSGSVVPGITRVLMMAQMPSTTRIADIRSQPFTACRMANLAAFGSVAGGDDCGGLDHEDHRPLGRARPMHDTLRHHRSLARAQLDGSALK